MNLSLKEEACRTSFLALKGGASASDLR